MNGCYKVLRQLASLKLSRGCLAQLSHLQFDFHQRVVQVFKFAYQHASKGAHQGGKQGQSERLNPPERPITPIDDGKEINVGLIQSNQLG